MQEKNFESNWTFTGNKENPGTGQFSDILDDHR